MRPATRIRLLGCIVGASVVAGVIPLASAQGSWAGRVEVGFLKDFRPSITTGAEWRTPLGGEPELPTGGGPVVATARPWSLSAMATAGVTFARPRDHAVMPTVHAQLGVLRRISDGKARLGPYVYGALRPDVIGAAIRYEPLVPLGVQAGWLWSLDHHADGVLLSADVTWALLCDVLCRH